MISSGETPATLATAKRATTTAAHPGRTASVETASPATAVKATSSTAAVEATASATTVEAASTAATVPASAVLGESRTGTANKRERQKRREKKF